MRMQVLKSFEKLEKTVGDRAILKELLSSAYKKTIQMVLVESFTARGDFARFPSNFLELRRERDREGKPSELRPTPQNSKVVDRGTNL